ncbi:MAG: hypothetical protein V4553_04260 [Bacteroidota bacterium]
MKKLPLFFCLLLFACSSQKQTAVYATDISKYIEPYHIFLVGKWDSNYSIFTLVDAHDTYFTIKGNYNASLKRGDVYKP